MASYAETAYGFRYGPALVERTISDERWGVVLTITSPRQTVDIRVTPSGLIRLGQPAKAGGQEP